MRLIYSSKNTDNFQIVLDVIYDSQVFGSSNVEDTFEHDFDLLFEEIKEYVEGCGFTIKRERESEKSISKYLDVFLTVDPSLEINILVNMRISDHKNYNLKTYRIANRRRAVKWARQMNINIKQKQVEIVVARNDEDGIYKGLQEAIDKIDNLSNKFVK